MMINDVLNTGSRKDFVTLMFQILNPLKPYYTKDKAGLKIGNTSAHYEEASAQMEGFSRPLWALAPFLAGGGKDDAFEEIYRNGMIAGTNPKSPEYWGKCHDYDQRFVEMAAISFSILLIPDKVWKPLSDEQKSDFADWLYEINRHECCSCNWMFFKVMVNVALESVGMPYDQKQMTISLDFIDSCYREDGWYVDGENGQVDYYVPFGMHYYGIMYAMFMKEKDPIRSERFMKRAMLFGKEFAYWFAEDGSALAYGRSQTYRFAQCSFYSICIAAGIEPLPKAVMKGIIMRHLKYWMDKPIFDNAGILTIGYCYPNLSMSESYNAPGSPYWSMKTFAVLLLDENDEFWKIKEEKLPELENLKCLKYADMIVQRINGSVIAYPGGRLMEHQHTHTEEKYSKFAYSTKYGFSVMHSQITMAEAAPDSTLAFEVFGHVFVRGQSHDFKVMEDKIISNWSPIDGIEVCSTIIPTKNGHKRIHVIKSSYDCIAHDTGFAVPVDSDVEMECKMTCIDENGRYELLKADPNTNLIVSKTVIPMITYEIHKGENYIETMIESFK